MLVTYWQWCSDDFSTSHSFAWSLFSKELLSALQEWNEFYSFSNFSTCTLSTKRVPTFYMICMEISMQIVSWMKKKRSYLWEDDEIYIFFQVFSPHMRIEIQNNEFSQMIKNMKNVGNQLDLWGYSEAIRYLTQMKAVHLSPRPVASTEWIWSPVVSVNLIPQVHLLNPNSALKETSNNTDKFRCYGNGTRKSFFGKFFLEMHSFTPFLSNKPCWSNSINFCGNDIHGGQEKKNNMSINNMHQRRNSCSK